MLCAEIRELTAVPGECRGGELIGTLRLSGYQPRHAGANWKGPSAACTTQRVLQTVV